MPVKKFWKSVKKWQSYGHEFGVSLFGTRCISITYIGAFRQDDYLISSNRSRASNTSRVSNTSRGSDFICSNRSRVSNRSRGSGDYHRANCTSPVALWCIASFVRIVWLAERRYCLPDISLCSNKYKTKNLGVLNRPTKHRVGQKSDTSRTM